MPLAVPVDPAPLTPAQVRAAVGAAARELAWGLPEVAREIRAWRSLAELIPDRPIRDDALQALERKRTHADGAALFSVLPARRDGELLRLLVAYETILDFLDNVSERHTTEANGRELHLALVEAVEPDRPLSDYYRHHPWRDDGGYLETLVESCRRWCSSLPSFGRVRALVVQEAERMQALALNHLDDPAARDAALERWAEREFPGQRDLRWFELSGAASASLVVLALLTLATRPDVSSREVAETYAVYWPWISLTAVMLDSYADQADDAASGDHSYVAHYPDPQLAVRRLRDCIARATRGARGLSDGDRHAVIVACMVAMYLSKDSAYAPPMRATTQQLLSAGGSLTRLLFPVLRIWRALYGQRTA
jgi:tetraprenyl-beta-curcumene synthase